MLTATTLREFIERLKSAGRYVRVNRPVALRHELAAVLGKTLNTSGQAAHFTNVGMGSTSVIGNVFGGRDKFAILLDQPASRLAEVYEPLWRYKPLAPNQVAKAPVQEIVHEGEVNAPAILPVPTHHALDGGPYITAALLLYRDPDHGAMNASFQRLQVLGGNELVIQALPAMNIFDAYQRAAKRGQELPLALAIGAEPALFMAGGIHIPAEADEYEFAGAVQERPLDVVPAKTIDLLVPANSEFIVECSISRTEERHEGPFGEMHRYYGGSSQKPLVRISAITHRPEPIYHTILSGNVEEHTVCALPREGRLLGHLRRITPEVKNVSFLPFFMRCVVSVGDCTEEEIDAVLEGIMEHTWARMGIVVNDDIDIDNAEDILWAIISRTDSEQDVRIEDFAVDMDLEDINFPPFASKRLLQNEPPPPDDVVASPFNLQALGEATRTRMAINAAVPKGARRWFQRSRLEGYEKIDLRDYLVE